MGMGEYQAAGVKKGSRMDTMHKQGHDIMHRRFDKCCRIPLYTPLGIIPIGDINYGIYPCYRLNRVERGK